MNGIIPLVVVLVCIGSGRDVGAQTPADEQAFNATTAPSNRTTAAQAPAVQGTWRVVETAQRAPGGTWEPRSITQGGLYIFTARHYSYFYVRSAEPRARFADASKPTPAEMAAAYDSIIAGAGAYRLEGSTLLMKADLRKNPNEMTGETWRWDVQIEGETMRLVFASPPFLPGREWRVTVIRVE